MQLNNPFRQTKLSLALLLLIAMFFVAVLFVFLFLPVDKRLDASQPMTSYIGEEWKKNFGPATERFINGKSPYAKCCFYNPPWALIPFIPLTFFSPEFASAVIFVVNLYIFGFVAYKMGAKPLLILAFLTTPQILHLSFSTNIDFLVPLGFILPPQIGMFFVMVKPQIGIPIAIYWFVDTWRNSGFKKLVWVFGPVSIILLLTFILYGFWPSLGLRLGVPGVRSYNAAVWPYALPIGIGLLLHAIRVRKQGFAILSAPLLTRYIAPHTWAIPVLGFLPDQIVFVASCLGLWLTWLLNPCIGGFGLYGICN